MKKLSKKGVLLFAAAMALCAFAMPTMAGAASWTVVGSAHTLDSPNVGFTSTTAAGTVVSQCTSSSFVTNVASSANLEITGATFGGDCTALVNQGAGNLTCTVDSGATRLPWTATALAGGAVQIHGVHIDVKFTQSSVGNCPAALIGQTFTITGTINSGSTYNSATHVLTLNNAEGLSSHSILGTSVVTARGTFSDTAGTLTIDG
jgi:hypothetical protein